MVVASG
jgi:hypothetical protein